MVAVTQWIAANKFRLLSALLALKVLIVEGIIDGNWNVAIPIIVATLFSSVANLARVRAAGDFLKSHRGPVVALFAAVFGVIQGATTGDWTSIVESVAGGVLPSAMPTKTEPMPLGPEYEKK